MRTAKDVYRIQRLVLRADWVITLSRGPKVFVVASVVSITPRIGMHEFQDRATDFMSQSFGGSCGTIVEIRFRRSRFELLVGHGLFFQQLRVRRAARCAETRAHFE